MDIKEYRQAILEAVLAAKDENGEPKIDELTKRVIKKRGHTIYQV